MKINHFGIARWGNAQLHWDGTKEELDYFKKWVEKYVPKKYFGWHKRVGRPGEEFHDTHLAGYFDCNAWVFLCYHWTPVSAPAINQIWKEKKNPYYPGQYPFNGVSDLPGHELLEHDNAILNLAMAYLQKEAMDDGRKTPELKECIEILHKKWRVLYDKLQVIRENKERGFTKKSKA
jgi:hypothetical protein